MIIHRRHVESLLKKAQESFKVILLSGPRQVGKTTLLKKLLPDVACVTFDPVTDIYHARQDPDAFLKTFPSPLILDEVQYVPALLSSLKRHVDLSDEKGRYFLCGSQNLSLLRTVSESMFGRVGIINLEHMSLLELANVADDPAVNWLSTYLENPHQLKNIAFDILGDFDLFDTVWRGGFPSLLQCDASLIPSFFEGYIGTYVERDVRTMSSLRNIDKFHRFLTLCAALSSQEINATHLGRELGLSYHAAQEWVQLLKQSFQWRTLQPYFTNDIRRVARKPKGYMTDTGLLCHLLNIHGPGDLENHSLRGAVFETWVVNHIHQLATQLSAKPSMYHWRSLDSGEVDIVLEYKGFLYPIEIKLTQSLRTHDLRGIQSFRRAFAGRQVAPALIIYGGDTPYAIDENTFALPWHAYRLP